MSVEKNAACRVGELRAEGIACIMFLTHLAAPDCVAESSFKKYTLMRNEQSQPASAASLVIHSNRILPCSAGQRPDIAGISAQGRVHATSKAALLRGIVCYLRNHVCHKKRLLCHVLPWQEGAALYGTSKQKTPGSRFELGLFHTRRICYIEAKQGGNMNNEHEGASWEGAWKLVYGIMLLPVILFPFWMLWGIIADVIIQPMLYPY